MKALLVKMSSFGDLIHTLPAVTDAVRAIPDLKLHWVVEESFAEIPKWHYGVEKVLPAAFRRWKKTPLHALFGDEWRGFRDQLAQENYDVIIDAQGLMKSAWVTRIARGTLRWGFDVHTAREKLAAMAYDHTVRAEYYIIPRIRRLMSAALGYALDENVCDYGIANRHFPGDERPRQPYVVFAHGTTWPNKLWPLRNWVALARLVNAGGYMVCLPWGNVAERERASLIARECDRAEVLPQLSLSDMAAVIQSAYGVVGVDTGFTHLAAALEVPSVGIFGPTVPPLSGERDNMQRYLVADFQCAPCFKRKCGYDGPSQVTPACYGALTPQRVWDTLAPELEANE